MLVLSRDLDESVMIGDDVAVTVIDIMHGKVRLGFTAPRDVPIHRREVWLALKGQEPPKEDAA